MQPEVYSESDKAWTVWGPRCLIRHLTAGILQDDETVQMRRVRTGGREETFRYDRKGLAKRNVHEFINHVNR